MADKITAAKNYDEAEDAIAEALELLEVNAKAIVKLIYPQKELSIARESLTEMIETVTADVGELYDRLQESRAAFEKAGDVVSIAPEAEAEKPAKRASSKPAARSGGSRSAAKPSRSKPAASKPAAKRASKPARGSGGGRRSRPNTGGPQVAVPS